MRKPTRPVASALRTLLLCCAASVPLSATGADTPPVVDSDSIVRSLSAPQVSTRGFVVEARPAAAAPPSATGELAQLGAALNSPTLAHTRFLIAGHTSATGDPKHNQALSESRARSVRTYLVDH